MIWIPIFFVVTLLFQHAMMVRSLERDRNLVEGTRFDDAAILAEVCKLKSGYPKTNAKFVIILLNVVVLGVSAAMMVWFDEWIPGPFSFRGVIVGIGAGVMVDLWPMAGFHPFQFGYILVDRESLRVPRGLVVREFAQRDTRVWMSRSSDDVCSCLVRDGHKRAHFVIDDESMEILKLWAMYGEEQS